MADVTVTLAVLEDDDVASVGAVVSDPPPPDPEPDPDPNPQPGEPEPQPEEPPPPARLVRFPAERRMVRFSLSARASQVQKFSPLDPVDTGTRHGADFGPLLAAGETIASATPTVTPSGMTLGAITVSGSVVAFTPAGHVAGRDYRIALSVITSTGRPLKRSVLIPARQL